MKKKTLFFIIALMTSSSAWASTSVTAPCDSSCATCQNAINTFQEQAQQTLAVATPPNPQNTVSNDSCLGNAFSISLSSNFSGFSISSLLKKAEQTAINAACSAAKSAISSTVSKGNSLLNFSLPSSEFTSLTGMSSFTPLSISNNTGSTGVTFSNSDNSNLWNSAASTATNTATGTAASDVNSWYNNVLP